MGIGRCIGGRCFSPPLSCSPGRDPRPMSASSGVTRRSASPHKALDLSYLSLPNSHPLNTWHAEFGDLGLP